MTHVVTYSLLNALSPLRLAGALFDKELRVSSRRVRNYALRSGYILLLSILVLSAWYAIVGVPTTALGILSVSRSSLVARSVATRIITFQFAAAQVIVAVMLSAAISDEMRRGTLSVLMTTPINSVQIVVGKVLSRLLQVVLLLAISLPVLAVLRVLGGVPWDYVVAGTCVTLTASVFAGALSLWLSTRYRHPYQALSTCAVVYLVVFLGVPAVAALIWGSPSRVPAIQSLLDLTNPFRAYRILGSTVYGGGRPGPGSSFSWPIHCLIMVSASAGLLLACSWRVRKAALGRFSARVRRLRPVMRTQGAPVAWRERVAFPHRRRGDVVTALAVVAVCALALAAKLMGGRGYEVYLYYVSWSFWIMALLRLAVSAAGGIAREKESGHWPLLLVTPLDDREILRGKARAAVRRGAPLLLAGCIAQLCFVFCVGAGPWILIPLQMVASALFVLGAGLYCGVRFRTSTTAVAATMGGYLVLNYVVGGRYNPLFTWLIRQIIYRSSRGYNNYVVLALGMGAFAIVLNVALGLFFWRRAPKAMRRHIF